MNEYKILLNLMLAPFGCWQWNWVNGIAFPNPSHPEMVLDCDSDSMCLDVFKLHLRNQKLHPYSSP